jgi:peptidyl-prolyl cis-trans isomerase SurA
VRIEHGEDFAALAKANSDDTGSAAIGGELGWINPGQTVAEFEQAVNALQLNELSRPVHSPFGVHLIQLLSRRQQDISSERNQAGARQQIQTRKAEERYQQWLQQLRDEAFVEFHTDNVN